MRIGIDIRTLMDKQYSGVPEYTFNLVKAILSADQKNEYVLFYNSGKDISSRMPVFSGVETIKTAYPNKIFNYFMQTAANRPLIDKKLKVDLFFMPHINFIALSGHVKKILTIHDLSFLRYPEFFSRRKNIWHKLINVSRLVKKFDRIAAVSEHTARDLSELLEVSPGRVDVIHSGIGKHYRKVTDHDRLDRIKQRYRLPDRFILFLGTLEPRKNLSGLIEAFSLLNQMSSDFNDVGLVIAGGAGWKYREIEIAYHNSRYRDRIKFIGYIRDKDKSALYSSAALFAYPSFYEGFGFPPLEALACGCPALISTESSLPEIAGEDAITVDPYNIAAIAKGLYKALQNDKNKENNNKTAEKIIAKFSWENAAKNYLLMFDKIFES